MKKLCRVCWVVVFSLLCLAEIAGAEVQSFQLDGITVGLNVPEHWLAEKDKPGPALIVGGPEGKEGRAVVIFNPINAVDGGAEQQDAEVLAGRLRKEIEEGFGVALDGPLLLQPYRKLRLPGADSGFAFGYRFELVGREIVGDAYYQACKGILFQINTLFPARNSAEEVSKMQSVLDSFTCRREEGLASPEDVSIESLKR